MSTPWLDARQLRSWIALTALTEALPAALDTQLKRDAGINHFEYMILASLADAPDRTLLMSDIAAFATGSISRLSHAVSRLESRGWVTRQPYADDARHMQVTMTDAGYAANVAAAAGHVREARRLVIDALTPEQLDQLGAIARTIVEVAAPQSARQLDRIADQSVTG